MGIQITITLPDEVYHSAERLARISNQDVASVLAASIQLPISSTQADLTDFPEISTLSDEQVLALTELQLEPEQDMRFSELLDHQQAGILTENERLELQTLMQIYQESLLQKATALSEAVKRGLIAPLSS